MQLKGKTAVITGAGGGIGSALVKRLKKEGVNLILIERDLNLLEHLVDFVDGPENKRYEADLSKPKEIVKLSENISREVEKVDLLFHVAGVGIYKPIEKLSLEEWELSLNINVTAPFLITKELMPLLKKSEDPLVVSIGSGTGVKPYAGRVAYCSSKFALRGLSLVLSKEYKKSKVNFLLMTFGSIMTAFGPGGLERRKKLQEGGKKYLSVEEVVEKTIESIKDDNRKDEVELYPPGYLEE